MAPEIAMHKLQGLPAGSKVLDPMAGSGTVIRQALGLGLDPVGFDVDPLAILMARAWTSPLGKRSLQSILKRVNERASSRWASRAKLRWIDDDPETKAFIGFWFAAEQIRDLRRLAYAIASVEGEASTPSQHAALGVIKVALSRLIITKDRGASLARDVSHSRPHRVRDTNDFDVLVAFQASVAEVCARLEDDPVSQSAKIAEGDARNLSVIKDASIDAVVTSPPYLNAIDYMRGHRLSLVWLGHRVSHLRGIRSGSIGSERALRNAVADVNREAVRNAMNIASLATEFDGMVNRYIADILRVMSEVARVLKAGGKAVMVVGDSCLREVFVRNSSAVQSAGEIAGLKLIGREERELPTSSRYLPLTSESLGRRMRREAVLTFAK